MTTLVRSGKWFLSAIRLRAIVVSLRPHQWVKNVLVFVPLLMAHRFGDWARFGTVCVGFLSFSAIASAGYLLNDLLDRECDREHSEKRRRPIAAGDLPARLAYFVAGLVVLAGGVLALKVSVGYLGLLLGYAAVTGFYSLHLKKIPLADVLCLGCLYAWRLFAGAAAADVPLSAWLMALSIFLFFSLALAKRVSELTALVDKAGTTSPGRGYFVTDLPQLKIFGTASGYLALLVFALYINSETVRRLYAYPELLWMVLPILLYWVSRVWLLAHRGKLDSDPIVFALKDRVSYFCIVLAVVFLIAARG